MEAFEKAVRLGAQGVELDVHLSADGELMVIHDEDIARTSDGAGRVADMTLAQLRAFNYNKGFEDTYKMAAIPTLAEVYELIKPCGILVNVEVKTNANIYPGIERKLIRMETDMGMRGRVLYSSFNHYTLGRLKSINRKAVLGVLYVNALLEPWRYAKHIGAQALHPRYEYIYRYPGFIERAHACGIIVNAWTVNEAADIARLSDMGADVLITDKPDLRIETGRQRP
jgi:glycerophosphoryl diester phosphodiesterase